MAWDKDEPIDAEPLRTLAQKIRNGWYAIEEADEATGTKLNARSYQLGNRTSIASAADPVTVSGTHYAYSKEDSGGTQELFTKDSAGNIIQLTNDGSIGAPDVEFQVEDGWTFNGGNLVWAYGRVPAGGGAITGGVGLGTATVKTMAGVANAYEITLTRTPANANYVVIGGSITNSGFNHGRVVEYIDTTATTGLFGARLKRTNDDVTITTEPFFVMVIGGF